MTKKKTCAQTTIHKEEKEKQQERQTCEKRQCLLLLSSVFCRMRLPEFVNRNTFRSLIFVVFFLPCHNASDMAFLALNPTKRLANIQQQQLFPSLSPDKKTDHFFLFASFCFAAKNGTEWQSVGCACRPCSLLICRWLHFGKRSASHSIHTFNNRGRQSITSNSLAHSLDSLPSVKILYS